MILRANNPYGTGHGADVPFTMGWYNNPAIFKLVFCGVDPEDWKWGRDLDNIYRLQHLRDIFHDGHPKKVKGLTKYLIASD